MIENYVLYKLLCLLDREQLKDMSDFVAMKSLGIGEANISIFRYILEYFYNQPHSNSPELEEKFQQLSEGARGRLSSAIKKYMTFNALESAAPMEFYYLADHLFKKSAPEQTEKVLARMRKALFFEKYWKPENSFFFIKYFNLYIETFKTQTDLRNVHDKLEAHIHYTYLINQLRLIASKMSNSFKKNEEKNKELDQLYKKAQKVLNSFHFEDLNTLSATEKLREKAREKGKKQPASVLPLNLFIEALSDSQITARAYQERLQGLVDFLSTYSKNPFSRKEMELLLDSTFDVALSKFRQDTILLYKKMVELFKTRSDAAYDDIYQFCERIIFDDIKYSAEYINEIITTLLNFCIRKFNDREVHSQTNTRVLQQEKYAAAYIENIKFLDKNGLLLRAGVLPLQRMKNLLAMSLILKQTAYFDSILEKYRKNLEGYQDEQTAHPIEILMKIIKYLHLDNYSSTEDDLGDLFQQSRNSPFYNKQLPYRISVEKLLIKSFYEECDSRSIENFKNRIDSVRRYIRDKDPGLVTFQMEYQNRSLGYFRRHCTEDGISKDEKTFQKLKVVDQIWLERMERIKGKAKKPT